LAGEEERNAALQEKLAEEEQKLALCQQEMAESLDDAQKVTAEILEERKQAQNIREELMQERAKSQVLEQKVAEEQENAHELKQGALRMQEELEQKCATDLERAAGMHADLYADWSKERLEIQREKESAAAELLQGLEDLVHENEKVRQENHQWVKLVERLEPNLCHPGAETARKALEGATSIAADQLVGSATLSETGATTAMQAHDGMAISTLKENGGQSAGKLIAGKRPSSDNITAQAPHGAALKEVTNRLIRPLS